MNSQSAVNQIMHRDTLEFLIEHPTGGAALCRDRRAQSLARAR